MTNDQREKELLQLVKEAYDKDCVDDYFWLRDRLRALMQCSTKGIPQPPK